MQYPFDFKGRAVAIVAGGPSLSLAQVRLLGIARHINEIRVIAINDAVYPCWFADVAYACDRQWWEHHGDLLHFPGCKMRSRVLDPEGNDINRVFGMPLFPVEITGTTGIEHEIGKAKSGGNSAYQAMQVAMQAGATKIIFVGLDLSAQAVSRHWFGEHHPSIARHASFRQRVHDFEFAAPLMAAAGVDVVNVSPGSAVRCFRMASLETELPRASGLAGL